MALLGSAAVVVISDMADPVAHDRWHSHEHLPERLGIPGFLRARRCVAVSADVPRYLVIYEVENAEVMVSPPYLDRLNQPSTWTTETMKSVRSLSRTLTRVVASLGHGVGADLLSVALSPGPGRADQLRAWLTKEAMPKLAATSGVLGVHLLERNETVMRPKTAEESLRGGSDAAADWMVLLEGYGAAAFDQAADADLSLAALSTFGAQWTSAARYRLAHIMTRDDVAAARSASG